MPPPLQRHDTTAPLVVGVRVGGGGTMGRVLAGRLMPAFEGPIGGENLPTAVLVGAAGEELKVLSDTPQRPAPACGVGV